jgi:hypothetical protein
VPEETATNGGAGYDHNTTWFLFYGLIAVAVLFAVEFFSATRAPNHSLQAAADDLSFVLIPDTQNESQAIIDSICDWVFHNQSDRNIQAVITVGDLTNYATFAEFDRLMPCFNRLKQSSIIHVPIVGNHDYNNVNPSSRNVSNFDQYFGPAFFTGKSWYGGNFNNSNASYYVKFTHGTRKFLILALEFFPRPEAVAWASSIIDAHGDYEVIVTTHGYLDPDGTRTEDADQWGPNNYSLPAADNSGEELWNNLIRKKPNIKLVVSGHQLSGNTSQRSDVGDYGNTVHQVFNNWQTGANGGDGWIGLLELNAADASAKISYVRSYNPALFTLPWPLGTVSPNNWYDAAWGYRKVLTIDQSKVGGSLSNFPVLVSVTDGDLKSVSNGGKVASAQGNDLVFTDATNTKLAYEIERYNPATGELAAWVKVSTLSASTATKLHVYFGNSSASDGQNTAGVWDSDFVGVWHLDEISGMHQDSTSNGNHATAVTVSSQGGSGKVGGSDAFSASNHHVRIPATATSLKQAFSAMSVSAWVYPTSHATGTWGPTIVSTTDTDGWALRINNGLVEPDLRLSGGNVLQTFGSALPLNTWSYISYVYDGSKVTAYVNGVSAGTKNATGTVKNTANSNTCVFIVSDPNGCTPQASEFAFTGSVDEVRVSRSYRSSAWISTEYANQSSPATFISIGEQAVEFFNLRHGRESVTDNFAPQNFRDPVSRAHERMGSVRLSIPGHYDVPHHSVPGGTGGNRTRAWKFCRLLRYHFATVPYLCNCLPTEPRVFGREAVTDPHLLPLHHRALYSVYFRTRAPLGASGYRPVVTTMVLGWFV